MNTVKKISSIFAGIVMFVFMVLFFVSPANSIEVPQFLGYEGRLTNTSGTALTGSYSITFRIYNALSGGTALWSETQSSVSVSDGYFAVTLGSETTLSLPFDTPYWLSIEIASDGEMTPRQRIHSNGYAYASDISYASFATSTAPSTSTGALYFDTGDSNLYVHDGTSWLDLTLNTSTILDGTNTFSAANTFSVTTTHQGRLHIADGSVTLTGLAFANDPDTGIYRLGSNSMGLGAGSQLVLKIGNGQNQIRDGSVGAPALAFMNDSNTGLYSVTADELGISLGGTRYMHITATTNTVQSSFLEIKPTSGGNADLYLTREGGTTLSFQAQAAFAAFGTQTNDELGIKTNGDIQMRITTGGAVEIGGIVTSARGATADGDLVIDDLLEVQGNAFIEGSTVFDVTANDAFIVRKNDSGGDIFVVDTISGNVGIATSSPDYLLHVIRSDGGDVAGFTDTNGTCTINPTISGLDCPSDKRLKKDISVIDTALSSIAKIRPVTYRWLKETQYDSLHHGFIAQEIEEIIPEFVNTNSAGMKSVSYTHFIPLLVRAIQEQQIQINSLAVGTGSSEVNNLILDSLSVTNHVTLGEDTVGIAVISAGATQANITFDTLYAHPPVITVSPLDFVSAPYKITNITASGFAILLQNAISNDAKFSWHAFGTETNRYTALNQNVSAEPAVPQSTSLDVSVEIISSETTSTPVIETSTPETTVETPTAETDSTSTTTTTVPEAVEEPVSSSTTTSEDVVETSESTPETSNTTTTSE